MHRREFLVPLHLSHYTDKLNRLMNLQDLEFSTFHHDPCTRIVVQFGPELFQHISCALHKCLFHISVENLQLYNGNICSNMCWCKGHG